MVWSNILEYGTTVAAILSVASVLRQRDTIKVLNTNNSALRERVQILEDEQKATRAEVSACEDRHKENDKKITALQAELTAYKELSLVPKDLVSELISYDKQILAALAKEE